MQQSRLLPSVFAAALLAGCAGPATRADAPAVAIVAPPVEQLPAPTPAPSTSPMGAELALLERLAPDADPGVLALALEARACAVRNGTVDPASRLAVIDYSRPSTAKRLWVFDLAQPRLLHHEHVAHGQGTGDNLARRFSNADGSHATSLGLFRTAETYMGGNGYSLRMDGLDPGFNDNARRRAIVVHGADYAEPSRIPALGRLGRSHGCPAVRRSVARVLIDDLKQRQLLFAYADDADFLRRGRSFACDGRSAGQILAQAREAARRGGLPQDAVAAP